LAEVAIVMRWYVAWCGPQATYTQSYIIFPTHQLQ
jgi:hypothetical protein